MLYFSTVSKSLHSALEKIFQSNIFNSFRLVGGTSLSLQLGHRMSIDIDLFSDVTYGSLDFKEIEKFLLENFKEVIISSDLTAIGKSYFIGENASAMVKLDIFYSDPFIRDFILVDGIRMATLEEIIAMKMEVIQNIGRKKDFWDIHELLENYSIEEMIALHEERYPYSHNRELIISNLNNFQNADEDLDVVCLKGKHWEIIKADFELLARNMQNPHNPQI